MNIHYRLVFGCHCILNFKINFVPFYGVKVRVLADSSTTGMNIERKNRVNVTGTMIYGGTMTIQSSNLRFVWLVRFLFSL